MTKNELKKMLPNQAEIIELDKKVYENKRIKSVTVCVKNIDINSLSDKVKSFITFQYKDLINFEIEVDRACDHPHYYFVENGRTYEVRACTKCGIKKKFLK